MMDISNTKSTIGLLAIIVISILAVAMFTEPRSDSYPIRHYPINTSIVGNNDTTISDTSHLSRMIVNTAITKNDLLTLINKRRLENSSLNLTKLHNDDLMSSLAQLRAQDMIDHNKLNHNTSTYGLVNNSMSNFGIKWFYCAENAGISLSNYSMVNGWTNSTSHNHNLMSPKYTRSGIGIAKKENTQIYWFVQLFAD